MNTKDNLETNNRSNQAGSLADLPLTGEQAEETKGGASTGTGGGGQGKVQMQDLHFTTVISR